MEYLEGETLKQPSATGPMEIDACSTWRFEMADALDAAHRRALSIATSSRRISLSPRAAGAKILDFGLAKVQTPGNRALEPSDATKTKGGTRIQHLTSPGSALGTVAYMSPGAGAGQAARFAHGFIFLWHRPLRDGDGRGAISRGNVGRHLRRHLNRAPLAPVAVESRTCLPSSKTSSTERSKKTASCATSTRSISSQSCGV